MIQALEELSDFVFLIASLREIQELPIFLQVLELTLKDHKEPLVEWSHKEFDIYRFETPEEVWGIGVLVHVEDVDLLSKQSCKFLDWGGFSCTCFSH